VRPYDLPPADHYAHGTHARYVAGCRCAGCRAGHAAYARARYRAQKLRGDWNGLVSAARARAHLLALSKRGVGRRSVRAACDVAESVLQAVRSGRKKQIRARTEKAILAVDAGAIAGGALVSARRTWRLVAELVEEGFTKAEISRRIGQGGRALQLGRERVTVENAHKVAKLYRLMMLGGDAPRVGRDRSGRANSIRTRLDAEARERIAEAVYDGMTIRAAAERFKVSPTTVQKVYRESARAEVSL